MFVSFLAEINPAEAACIAAGAGEAASGGSTSTEDSPTDGDTGSESTNSSDAGATEEEEKGAQEAAAQGAEGKPDPARGGDGEAGGGGGGKDSDVLLVHDTGFNIKIDAPGIEPFDLPVSTATRRVLTSFARSVCCNLRSVHARNSNPPPTAAIRHQTWHTRGLGLVKMFAKGQKIGINLEHKKYVCHRVHEVANLLL